MWMLLESASSLTVSLPDTWTEQDLPQTTAGGWVPQCRCSTATVCSLIFHRCRRSPSHPQQENLHQKQHTRVKYILSVSTGVGYHHVLLFCWPGAPTRRTSSFHRAGFTLTFWFSSLNSTSQSLSDVLFFRRTNTSAEPCRAHESRHHHYVWTNKWTY